MQPFELDQVCFNPKLVADFKDALVLREPKDDDLDAFDVAARVPMAPRPVAHDETGVVEVAPDPVVGAVRLQVDVERRVAGDDVVARLEAVGFVVERASLD